MAELHNLKKINTKGKKRRGRGASSGVGGTSGRGHKGERARAGKKISSWFEVVKLHSTEGCQREGSAILQR